MKINIEDIRADPVPAPASVLARNQVSRRRRLRPTQTRYFVKGPIDLQWVSIACHLPGSSSNLAWAVHYLAGRAGSQTVTLGHKTLDLFNVTRQTSASVLRRWEVAGLVTVERQCGHAPRVTILELGS